MSHWFSDYIAELRDRIRCGEPSSLDEMEAVEEALASFDKSSPRSCIGAMEKLGKIIAERHKQCRPS